LILGIISIFFTYIGIIPTAGLVASIIALFYIKHTDKKHEIFLTFGIILSVIYFITYIFTFSTITQGEFSGTDLLGTTKYPKITWLSLNEKGVVQWGFENGRYRNAWDCYDGCKMIFVKNGSEEYLFSSDMPTQNGCDTWHNLTNQELDIIKNKSNVCAKITCADGKESEYKCWNSN